MAAWFMLQSFMSLHLIDTRHFDPFYGTIWMSQEQKRTGGIKVGKASVNPPYVSSCFLHIFWFTYIFRAYFATTCE